MAPLRALLLVLYCTLPCLRAKSTVVDREVEFQDKAEGAADDASTPKYRVSHYKHTLTKRPFGFKMSTSIEHHHDATVVIKEVSAESRLELKAGDLLVSIGGNSVRNYKPKEIARMLKHAELPLEIEVERPYPHMYLVGDIEAQFTMDDNAIYDYAKRRRAGCPKTFDWVKFPTWPHDVPMDHPFADRPPVKKGHNVVFSEGMMWMASMYPWYCGSKQFVGYYNCVSWVTSHRRQWGMNIHNNPYRHLEARKDHPGEMRCLKFEAMFSPSPEGYSPGCPTKRLVLNDIPEGECIDDIIAQGIPSLKARIELWQENERLAGGSAARVEL